MEQCKKILEGIEDPLFVMSSDKEVIYENPAAKELKSSIGIENFKKIVDKAYNPQVYEKGIFIKGIFLELPDYKFLIDVFPYQNEGLTVLVRDITRFIELEEFSKKEGFIVTITKLLADIFHDLKGPLGGIKGAVQLLKEDPEDTELIDDIMYEVKRLENLISEITFITKPTHLNKRKTNVHELLDKALKTLKNTYPDVTFIRKYDPSIPEILIDKDYIMRVFVNIIKNGIEATDGKGTVTISTGISWDRVYSPKGKKIFIRIKDSGKGIPEEMLDKLFLPFNSTKKNGMGIGLSSAYKIVKDHGGILRYIGDATFEILLPID